MNETVVGALRRLADNIEKGRYKGWKAHLEMLRPEVECHPMDVPLDNLRHFRAGDEVTATLVLTR